jgi:putative ABC transport system permease protein
MRRAVRRVVQQFVTDVRYALRLARRSRAFSATVVLVIALGIGLNTAMFSLVNAVLLTSLPFDQPGRLVRLYSSLPERNLTFFSVSAPDYLEWKARVRSMTVMGAFSPPRDLELAGTGDPSEVTTARVSSDVFRVLGVNPLLGRGFVTDEEKGLPVVIVSHAFWASRLNARGDAIGSALMLDGQLHTVVGVMPTGFSIPGSPAEVWTPLAFTPSELQRDNHFLRVLARLRPDASVASAQAEMEQVAKSLAQQFPARNIQWTARVRTLEDLLIGDNFQRAVLVLTAAVCFVLVIACANVANLLLARGAGRAREIATRAALGASGARVLRQVLTESLVLSLAGGILGVFVAVWSVETLKALDPGNIPRLDDAAVNARVLAFSGAITILTGLLFGLLPALQASRTGLIASLRQTQTMSSLGRRLRSGLVVAQLALAMVLLAGATLMIKSFVRVQDVALGFEPDRVVTMPLTLSTSRYDDAAKISDFYMRLQSALQAVPGVAAVGASTAVPMSGLNSGLTFRREGDPPADQASAAADADYRVVTAGYFETLHIRLMRGRVFIDRDRTGTTPVVVISDSAARRYWPGQDPIGMRIEVGSTPETLTIVGVVADVRHFGPEGPVRPLIYFCHAQRPARTMVVVVRTTAAPAAVVAALRSAVWSIDRQQAIGTMQSMPEIVAAATAQRRFNMVLSSVFGVFALILAAVGVYGVMSHAVAVRTREMGLRMALGARARDVQSLILWEGLRLAAAGVSTGLVLGLWLVGWAASLLFQVDPHDTVMFAGSATILSSAALLACYLPARRATAADPATALRAE